MKKNNQIKEDIIENINRQLNFREKFVLFISKKYSLKIFKLGVQYYFNFENATYHTNIKSSMLNANIPEELIEAMEKVRQVQKQLKEKTSILN